LHTRAMINARYLLSAALITTSAASLVHADTPKPPPLPAKTKELMERKLKAPTVKLPAPTTVRPTVKAAPDTPSPVVVEMIAGAAPKVEGRSSTNTGVLGETSAKGQAGVQGNSTHAESVGVAAQNTATGSRAQLAAGGVGALGEVKLGTGVYGAAKDTGMGVFGEGGTNGGTGVLGRARNANAAGVTAEGPGGAGTALRVSKGAIRIDRGAASPSFKVTIDYTTSEWGCNWGQSVWTCGGYVTLDHPLTNNDPDVSLFLTVEGYLSGDSWLQTMYWDGKWHVLLPSHSQGGISGDPSGMDPRQYNNVLHVLVIKH
jgi:hypothetical protein